MEWRRRGEVKPTTCSIIICFFQIPVRMTFCCCEVVDGGGEGGAAAASESEMERGEKNHSHRHHGVAAAVHWFIIIQMRISNA